MKLDNLYYLNELAYNLLLKIKIDIGKPVNTYKIAKALNLEVHSFLALTKEDINNINNSVVTADCFIKKTNNKYSIYINSKLPLKKIRYLLALEVARYLLYKAEVRNYYETLNNLITLLLVPLFTLFFISDISKESIMKLYDCDETIASRAISLFRKRNKKFGSKLFQYEMSYFISTVEC